MHQVIVEIDKHGTVEIKPGTCTAGAPRPGPEKPVLAAYLAMGWEIVSIVPVEPASLHMWVALKHHGDKRSVT